MRSPASTSALLIAGFRFSAWLAGMVQAVVVQTSAKASLAKAGRPNAAARLALSCALKATWSVLLCLSAYSISNSASELPQSKHQCTGLRPRYKKPRAVPPLEGAGFAGFVGVVHGLVGVVPCAEHAQALKVGHLLRDLHGGVGAALGLHVVAREL